MEGEDIQVDYCNSDSSKRKRHLFVGLHPDVDIKTYIEPPSVPSNSVILFESFLPQKTLRVTESQTRQPTFKIGAAASSWVVWTPRSPQLMIGQ
jgi:hypothetical protein